MLSTSRNYNMTLRKKYIHLWFVIGLFLHSLPVMGAEFMYGSVSQQEVVEVTTGFSEILKDNPIIMPVAGAAAIVGLLLYGRGEIRKQYDATLKEVKEKKESVESKIPFPVKK